MDQGARRRPVSWTDNQEFLLDKTISRYVRHRNISFRQGEKLTSTHLWPRGGRPGVFKAIVQVFKRSPDSEEVKASRFADGQIQSKIDNMLKSAHWEWCDIVAGFKRTAECRQAKRNQKVAYANHAERAATAANTRERAPPLSGCAKGALPIMGWFPERGSKQIGSARPKLWQRSVRNTR
jgi:hypothetical protein